VRSPPTRACRPPSPARAISAPRNVIWAQETYPTGICSEYCWGLMNSNVPGGPNRGEGPSRRGPATCPSGPRRAPTPGARGQGRPRGRARSWASPGRGPQQVIPHAARYFQSFWGPKHSFWGSKSRGRCAAAGGGGRRSARLAVARGRSNHSHTALYIYMENQ
jgi:hypothetical protein